MRYLFEVGHPAEVHCFKHTINNLKQKGHAVLVAARDKDITLPLLKALNIDHVPLGKNYPSKLAKFWSLLVNNFHLLRLIHRFKPDLVVSFFSPYAAQAGKLMRKTVIGFHDTEHARLAIAITRPFTDCLVVPEGYLLEFKKREPIRFKGYFELAYLHPNHFQPDPTVLDLLGVKKGGKYVLLRFVSHSPVHDRGMQGIGDDKKVWLYNQLQSQARVFISSETGLPEPLKPFQLNIPAQKIHDALFYASLLFSESATMTSEAAVLGIPAIFLYPGELGYILDQQDRHQMVFHYKDPARDLEMATKKAIQLINNNNTHEEWQQKREKMMGQMIDVQAFMEWFLCNYPQSRHMMRQHPDTQMKFK